MPMRNKATNARRSPVRVRVLMAVHERTLVYVAVFAVTISNVMLWAPWIPDLIPPMVKARVGASTTPKAPRQGGTASAGLPRSATVSQNDAAMAHATSSIAPVEPTLGSNPITTPIRSPSDNAMAAAQARSEPKCDVSACAQAYRSFRKWDCTYQPYNGPRRLCTKGTSVGASNGTTGITARPNTREGDHRQSKAQRNVIACKRAIFAAKCATESPRRNFG